MSLDNWNPNRPRELVFARWRIKARRLKFGRWVLMWSEMNFVLRRNLPVQDDGEAETEMRLADAAAQCIPDPDELVRRARARYDDPDYQPKYIDPPILTEPSHRKAV